MGLAPFIWVPWESIAFVHVQSTQLKNNFFHFLLIVNISWQFVMSVKNTEHKMKQFMEYKLPDMPILKTNKRVWFDKLLGWTV